MLDLDEIERVTNAATDGPWRQGAFLNDVVTEVGSGNLAMHCLVVDADYPATAVFVASARAWVPQLVARVRELEAQVSDLTGELAATEAGREYFNRAWADAIAVLRMVEWADGEEYCPWCGGGKPWDEGKAGGHKPNCPWLAATGKK